jgi:hypothetical protein
LKRYEFVIIHVLVTNRGKWLQLDERKHSLSIRLGRIQVKRKIGTKI